MKPWPSNPSPRRPRPYARNVRTHSDAQVALFAASIRKFGFVNFVLIDEQRTILADHRSVAAARKRGPQEVPAV